MARGLITLYLNSTQGLTIGLWDGLKWIYFKTYADKKNSEWFHFELNNILIQSGLEISQLKDIVWCAGPGSYTGLRMVAGPVEALSWLGMKIKSFYAFEVGKILGEETGIFSSFAFKGEYFCYRWNGPETMTYFTKVPPESQYWTLGEEIVENTKDVGLEIKSNFKKIYDGIRYENKENLRTIYYYRPPEKEFNVTQGR